MLGSNGIQWLSVDNMLKSTDTLVTLIKTACPDTEVMIISVPPVTPEYAATVKDIDVMTEAFREFTAKKLGRDKKPSIRKLLSTLKDKAAALNAQKDKVKKKDREVSL